MSRLALALGAAVLMSASSAAFAETVSVPGNLCKPVSGAGSATITYPAATNGILNTGAAQSVVCPLPRALISNPTTMVLLGATAGTTCTVVSTNGFNGNVLSSQPIGPGSIVSVFAPFGAVLSLRCSLLTGGQIFGYGDVIE